MEPEVCGVGGRGGEEQCVSRAAAEARSLCRVCVITEAGEAARRDGRDGEGKGPTTSPAFDRQQFDLIIIFFF